MDQPISLYGQIDSLTSQQAQQAALKLFEQLPENWWEDGEKLSTMEIEARVTRMQHAATGDLQTVLAHLTTGASHEDDELRGALAKAVLHTLNGPDFEPFHANVRLAVEDAQQPHMSIVLGSIGAYLIVMALLPTKVQISKEDGVNIEFGNLKNFVDLSSNLKDILDKLTPFGSLLNTNPGDDTKG